MSVTLESVVSVPSDTLINFVEDESVLLNLENETYYGLNKVGTRMWKALTSSPSVQAAYESLLANYSVEAEVLRHDLLALIQELADQGLLNVQE